MSDTALAFAFGGTPTFPAGSNKRPVVKGGFKSASTDPDTIKRMFADPRAALIAMPTGPTSGFDVLDIDPGKGGLEWLHANESRIPATRRHHTRSSGTHLYFRHAPGLRNSASKIAPGVDIRADGGYVIRWDAHGFYCDDAPIADWPDWLLIEAMRRQYREGSAPAPEELAPPSAADLLTLLRAMPNPESTTRDDYVAVCLAAQGCLRALDATGAGDADDADDIREAAADWAARWDSERASDAETELARWELDWSLRTNDVSGWRHILALADQFGMDTSPWRHAAAVAEFGELPDIVAPSTAPIPSVSPALPAAPADYLVLDHKAPLDSAKRFVAQRYTRDGQRTLHRQAGQFWQWTGTHYAPVGDGETRAAVYQFLDGAWQQAKGGALEPFNPTRSSVSDAIDALSAHVQQPDSLRAPAWLAASPTSPPAADIIACDNGLLHLTTRRLLPHTATLFNQHALDYAYQPDAPAAVEWPRFLHTLWEDDPDSIATLQELFGLLLTTDTKYQKLFLFVGPKRSGKGTIARVLTALIGAANVCAPTLTALGTNFGLQPLIGKLLAIIGDARLGGRVDVHVVAERLLSISGEDSITVDRKYSEAWTGKLPTRFLLLSNELPKLSDASGALASRFVLLQLKRTFYGVEDLGLDAKLLPELPGILNWALAGLDRLRARGYFVQPASARQAADELEELASPITAFIRDRCTVGPDERADCDEMYSAWVGWCREQGRSHVGPKPMFSRDLHAASPQIQTIRPRLENNDRRRMFAGIGLRQAAVVAPEFAANDVAAIRGLSA